MTLRGIVLSVGCNERNQGLLAELFEREGMHVDTVCSLEELDGNLDRVEEIAAVVIDLTGYDRRIWDRCERLRAADVPFVLLSRPPSAVTGREAKDRGARSILAKPVRQRQLVDLVRSLADGEA